MDAISALKANPKDSKLKKAKGAAEGKYKHLKIREALEEQMFHGKCAYCEAVVSHNQAPPIEHFKPKSRFPSLCFAWDNLLWACGKCNGSTYKGDHFPGKAKGGPILNPTVDRPERHLKFVYDEHTGTALVESRTKRGLVTRELLGLNRPELARHRRELMEKIFFIATRADAGDKTALSLILKSCQADSEYAAFARSIADRFGIDWKSQV